MKATCKDIVSSFENLVFGIEINKVDQKYYTMIKAYNNLLSKLYVEYEFNWDINKIKGYLPFIFWRLFCETTLYENNKDSITNGDFVYSDYFSNLRQEKDLNNKIIYRKIRDSNNDIVSILAFHTNLYDKFLNPIYFLYISKSEDSKEHFCLTLNEINKLSEYKNYIEGINIDKLKSIELDQLLFNYKNLSIDIQDIDTNEEKLKEFIENKIKNYIENNKNSKDKRKNNNERRDIYLGDILTKKWTDNLGKIRPQLQGWNHIIIDGIDNLPLALINTLINKKYYYINNYDGIRMLILDKENGVQGLYDCIKCIIKNSINESINMVNTSKLLIPSIYHATKNEISYILPLYLQHRRQPDCVLVFNKTDNGYIGKTLLNMEEAQIDARVLGSIQLYSWLHF